MEYSTETRRNYKKQFIKLQILFYRTALIQFFFLTIAFILFITAYSLFSKNGAFFGFLIFSIIFLTSISIFPSLFLLFIKIQQNKMSLLTKNWKKQIKSFIYSYIFKYEIWKKNALFRLMDEQDKRVLK